jgi:hypothetical protein
LTLSGGAKNENGTPIHKIAYMTLRQATRLHFDTNSLPTLYESGKAYALQELYTVEEIQQSIMEFDELNRQANPDLCNDHD